MSPEYGATCGIFPVDAETLRYLEFTGRPTRAGRAGRGLLPRAGAVPRARAPTSRCYSDTLELDLATVEPSLAGPSRPQDRVPLSRRRRATSARSSRDARRAARPDQGCDEAAAETLPGQRPAVEQRPSGADAQAACHEHRGDGGAAAADADGEGLDHGAVVIAAITSCTNTSNPSVMLGAGLLAKKAVEAGLTRRPWVKTSLAPGSKVVTEYLERAGLIEPLDGARLQPRRLRLHDLHRQLGPAAGGDLARDRGARPGRRARCCRATATSRAASTPR